MGTKTKIEHRNLDDERGDLLLNLVIRFLTILALIVLIFFGTVLWMVSTK